MEEWVRSCVHNAAVEKASLYFIGTEAVPAPPHEGGGAKQLQRSGAFQTHTHTHKLCVLTLVFGSERVDLLSI